MASNLELSELESLLLKYMQITPGHPFHESDLLDVMTKAFEGYSLADARQAISNLVSLNFISADEDLRYSAVGHPTPEPQCICWTENGKRVRDAFCQLHGF